MQQPRLPRAFYRTFFVLIGSIALQNLLTYSINLADNLMLGSYSETAMNGASMGNQIQFLLQMLVIGCGEGVVVLGAQYWGAGRVEPIGHIIGVALRFGGTAAAVLFGLVFFFPTQLLGLLTNDTVVITAGVQYVQIICFTYIIFTVTNILSASLRSIGNVRIGYILPASTLCINICLNYLLIYGNFGFPALGIRGAAIATLVSRCVELVIIVWYLTYREHRLQLTLRKLLCIDTSYLRDYIKISLPVVFTQGQWGIAQMVQTGILGHLGASAIAANAVATVLFQLLSVLSYGAASASAITVGKLIGAQQTDALRPFVRHLQIIFVSLGVLAGLSLFMLRVPVLSLYRLTPTSHALAMQFIAVLSVTTVGTSYQMACDTGIIRGGGDTAFSAKLNLLSMWLIVVPLSALAAFYWKLPAVVVFCILKSDQIYKILPVAVHLHRWKWIRSVTRQP